MRLYVMWLSHVLLLHLTHIHTHSQTVAGLIIRFAISNFLFVYSSVFLSYSLCNRKASSIFIELLYFQKKENIFNDANIWCFIVVLWLCSTIIFQTVLFLSFNNNDSFHIRQRNDKFSFFYLCVIHVKLRFDCFGFDAFIEVIHIFFGWNLMRPIITPLIYRAISALFFPSS